MRHLVIFTILTVVALGRATIAATDELVWVVGDALPLPEIDAKAWALIEYESGQMIVGRQAEQPFAPASITKLMTNYVIYEALEGGEISLTDQVAISEEAWRAEGSRMFAKVNSKVSLENLLKSTVIQSGNDAAIALAEHVSGSEPRFAQRMNQAAAKLTMGQSHFVNSTGLPDVGHQMSALDIGKLSRAIIRKFPEFYAWYSEKSFRHNNITQYNRNKLIWKDSSVDGLKTGHTEAAGYCLVGSAQRDEQRWLAVVLGASSEQSREKAVLDLLNFGFAAYRPVRMLDEQAELLSAPVFAGDVDEVFLRAEHAVNLVVPAGREDEIETTLEYSQTNEAPIVAGQVMGMASLALDGRVLAQVPLISMSTINVGPWWKRVIDAMRIKFTTLTAT